MTRRGRGRQSSDLRGGVPFSRARCARFGPTTPRSPVAGGGGGRLLGRAQHPGLRSAGYLHPERRSRRFHRNRVAEDNGGAGNDDERRRRRTFAVDDDALDAPRGRNDGRCARRRRRRRGGPRTSTPPKNEQTTTDDSTATFGSSLAFPKSTNVGGRVAAAQQQEVCREKMMGASPEVWFFFLLKAGDETGLTGAGASEERCKRGAKCASPQNSAPFEMSGIGVPWFPSESALFVPCFLERLSDSLESCLCAEKD